MSFKSRLLRCYTTTTTNMGPKVFAIICIIICIVAIYFSWKIYKDTRKIKKKVEEKEDDDRVRF